MRCTAVIVILALVSVRAAVAQEIGVFATTGWPEFRHGASSGVGGSIGGSFRLGAIIDTSRRLSRSQARVGARLGVSRLSWTELDYSRCADDCPVGAHDVHVDLTLYHGTLMLFPYRTSATRVEIAGGPVIHSYGGDARDSGWGFAAGINLLRRVSKLFWLTAGYDLAGRSLTPQMADASHRNPPRHVVRFGLAYRSNASSEQERRLY